MGGAFARGFVQGLVDENPEIASRIEFMLDMATFGSFFYHNHLQKSGNVKHHFKDSSPLDFVAGPGLPGFLTGMVTLSFGGLWHGLGNYDADEALNEVVRWARANNIPVTIIEEP